MSRVRLCLGLPALLFALGCTGTITSADADDLTAKSPGKAGDPGNKTGGAGVDPVTGKPLPGDDGKVAACGDSPSQPVRDLPAHLMTALELNHALRALLPQVDFDPIEMSRDGRVDGFLVNARETIDANHVEDLRIMAETIAEKASADPARVYACQGQGDALRTCALAFVHAFAAKAFRGLLSDEQERGLTTLYDAGDKTGGAKAALRYVLEALLQAPAFLYVHENVAAQKSAYELPPNEIAQRIAFAFLRSIPDDALRSDAVSGKLADADVRAGHVRRLLATPRGKDMLATFMTQWFGLDHVNQQDFIKDKDTTLLAQAMMDEDRRLIDFAVENVDGNWAEIVSASYTFVDDRMAKHYGVGADEGEALAGGIRKVILKERAGIFTHAGSLASHVGPIHRGLTLRKAVLCGDVPGPVGIDIEAIPTGPKESERSKAEKRLAAAGCGACHGMMDPLGLPFEVFDNLGRHRVTDQHGNPVSGNGNITGTEASDRNVQSAGEMMAVLAKSVEARMCAAQKLFLWTYARAPGDNDTALLKYVQDALSAGADSVPEALVALVSAPGYALGCGAADAKGNLDLGGSP